MAHEMAAILKQLKVIKTHQAEMFKLVAENNGLLRRNLNLFEVTQTLFPIDSEEKLKQLNDDLATEQKTEMIGVIKRILDSSFRNIDRILSKNIILDFNYDGAKNKKSLKNYDNVLNAIFEATRQEGNTYYDFIKELRVTFRRIKNTANKESARHGHKENT